MDHCQSFVGWQSQILESLANTMLSGIKLLLFLDPKRFSNMTLPCVNMEVTIYPDVFKYSFLVFILRFI